MASGTINKETTYVDVGVVASEISVNAQVDLSSYLNKASVLFITIGRYGFYYTFTLSKARWDNGCYTGGMTGFLGNTTRHVVIKTSGNNLVLVDHDIGGDPYVYLEYYT